MNTYCGRFAPSPTGPLHFGSLFAAVVSYLDAKANQGAWLIRIEDIDPPREQAGAIAKILTCLAAHDLEPDQEVTYQSEHSERYEAILNRLGFDRHCYYCPCSRKELETLGSHTQACQQGETDQLSCAIRFLATDKEIQWHDRFQGNKTLRIEDDFVLKRKDGLYAYQLAVVADDIAQGVTNIVRGIDLLDSTPMQIALYSALGQTPPNYAHFPVLTNDQEQKLSKQNRSSPVANERALDNIRLVAETLGCSVSKAAGSPIEIYQELLSQWPPSSLSSCTPIRAPESYSKCE